MVNSRLSFKAHVRRMASSASQIMTKTLRTSLLAMIAVIAVTTMEYRALKKSL